MAGKVIRPEPYGNWLHDWIYLFHMPVFFFVAGWLVEHRSAAANPPSPKDIGAGLLYPYFLWGAGIWMLHHLGDKLGVTNHQVGDWTPWNLYYPAHTGPWFLLVLAVFHLVFWMLLAIKRRALWCLIVGLVLYAGLTWSASHNIDSLKYLCGVNFVFYAAGAWQRSRVSFLIRQKVVVSGVICGVGLLAVVAGGAWVGLAETLWGRLPLGMVGVFGILILSHSLSNSRHSWLLERVGRHSLGIYLLHGLVLPVTRWVMVRLLHVDSEVMLLTVLTVAGVILPFATATLVERLRVGWIFRFGPWRQARIVPGNRSEGSG